MRVQNWKLWRAPRRVLLYVLLIDALGMSILAGALWGSGGFGEIPQYGVFLAIAGGVGLIASLLSELRVGVIEDAEAETNHIPDDYWTTALMLGLPLGLAGALHVVMYALTWPLFFLVRRLGRTAVLPEPAAPHKLVFNASMAVIDIWVARTVFEWASGGTGPPEGSAGVVAAVVATLAMSLSNVVVLGGVVALSSGTGVLSVWKRQLELLAPSYPVKGFGVLLVVAFYANPWSILLVPPFLFLIQRALLHSELLRLSRMDPKTGLANSAYWRRRAEWATASAARNGVRMSVLVVDLDHFKDVNDTHGHLAGDAVLIAAAERLRSAVGEQGLVGRFGGEEFTVYTEGGSIQEVLALGERCRKAVANTPVELGSTGLKVTVTCSVGVASVSADESASISDLLELADIALYRAKTSGRDRVCSSEDLELDPESASDLSSGNPTQG